MGGGAQGGGAPSRRRSARESCSLGPHDPMGQDAIQINPPNLNIRSEEDSDAEDAEARPLTHEELKLKTMRVIHRRRRRRKGRKGVRGSLSGPNSPKIYSLFRFSFIQKNFVVPHVGSQKHPPLSLHPPLPAQLCAFPCAAFDCTVYTEQRLGSAVDLQNFFVPHFATQLERVQSVASSAVRVFVCSFWITQRDQDLLSPPPP